MGIMIELLNTFSTVQKSQKKMNIVEKNMSSKIQNRKIDFNQQ